MERLSPWVVRVARTAETYTELDEVHTTFVELRERLRSLPLDRGRHGLLVDLRDGPLRSDPPFEAAAREHRQHLFDGFVAGAVLVRTLSGKIQLTRHERLDRVYRTFDDEDEALAFLRDAVLEHDAG